MVRYDINVIPVWNTKFNSQTFLYQCRVRDSGVQFNAALLIYISVEALIDQGQRLFNYSKQHLNHGVLKIPFHRGRILVF